MVETAAKVNAFRFADPCDATHGKGQNAIFAVAFPADDFLLFCNYNIKYNYADVCGPTYDRPDL